MIEPINVSDFEAIAQAKLDADLWGYFAGAAEDERTLRGNLRAFDSYWLRPRVLRNVSNVSPQTTVLGTEISFPVIVAPSAVHGMIHPDGECATAVGARSAGTVMTVSTSSSNSLEEISASSSGPKWFQLYLRRWEVGEALLQRAEAAGYKAVVLTVDMPCMGNRERDLRFKLNRREFPLGNYAPTMMEPAEDLIWDQLDWGVIEWVRRHTSLPIILKGILTAEDAALAVESGVDAIIVSNHGGRQIDGAIPSLYALPEIAAVAGHKCEVYVDGGVRRGTDILKAMALGARAVLVGRPVLWGLAADGANGVEAVLNCLASEFVRNLKLCGIQNIDEIDASILRKASEY